MSLDQIQSQYEEEVNKIDANESGEITQEDIDQLSISLGKEQSEVLSIVENQTYPKLVNLGKELALAVPDMEVDEREEAIQLTSEIQKYIYSIQKILNPNMAPASHVMQEETPMAFEQPEEKATKSMQTETSMTRQPIPADTPMPRPTNGKDNEDNNGKDKNKKDNNDTNGDTENKKGPQPVPSDTPLPRPVKTTSVNQGPQPIPTDIPMARPNKTESGTQATENKEVQDDNIIPLKFRTINGVVEDDESLLSIIDMELIDSKADWWQNSLKNYMAEHSDQGDDAFISWMQDYQAGKLDDPKEKEEKVTPIINAKEQEQERLRQINKAIEDQKAEKLAKQKEEREATAKLITEMRLKKEAKAKAEEKARQNDRAQKIQQELAQKEALALKEEQARIAAMKEKAELLANAKFKPLERKPEDVQKIMSQKYERTGQAFQEGETNGRKVITISRTQREAPPEEKEEATAQKEK